MTPGAHSGLLLVCASAVVAAAIAAGLMVIGSPLEHRRERLDQVRIHDLQQIQGLVLSYAKVYKRLPGTLQALTDEPGYAAPEGDPESGRAYIYRPMTRDTFRLCARFDTSSYGREDLTDQSFGDHWTHHAGDQCFDRHAEGMPVSSP